MSQVELTTLGESCEFFNGKAHEKSIDENGKYIVVNSKFISQEGRVVKRTKEQMFPLYKGDIVMVMSDVPNGKALAKCFIIDQDDTYSLNQRICCIRSKEFDTRYLYYQLNRNEHFLAFNNGENQTNLRKDDILACPLIKPSMEEQRRIVAEIETALFSLEQAKSNAEKNLQNAKELFESYLQGVFANQGEGWVEKSLGDIGKVSMCKRIFKKETSSEGEIPFYKIGTFGKEPNAYISSKLYNEYKSKYSYPKKGDILISASGTIGRRVIYDGEPAYFQDSNIVWIDNDEKQVLNDFLYFFYGQCDWNPSRGATISRLYNDDLRSIKINFPSIPEQKDFVTKFLKIRLESEKLETLYQKKIAALDELKKSILQKAFQGELETEKELAL